MPAVTIQLELDTKVMPVDRTTFAPLTALAAFSEQSRTTFKRKNGRLSIILTPPEKYLAMNHEKILETIIQDAKRLGIDLENKVKDYRVISEPADFYSLTTGTNKLRPPQKTPMQGLTLAGDYTKQDYLPTMEGAVVSGKLAAEAIVEN